MLVHKTWDQIALIEHAQQSLDVGLQAICHLVDNGQCSSKKPPESRIQSTCGFYV